MSSTESRRTFLKTSVGTALAAGMTPPPLSAQEPQNVEWRNRSEQMRYRRLGRTGFMVSEIVMGGNEITPDNYEHILMALDQGVNYLDTSPAYGQGKSELGFARVIKARSRDQFFLNSKVSVWDQNRSSVFEKIFRGLTDAQQQALRQRADRLLEDRGAANPRYLVNYFGGQIRELRAAALSDVMEQEYGGDIDRVQNFKQTILDSVDASLTRLGTDHLDLLMCPHGASSPDELLKYPEILEAFETLKRAGKVRYLGVSSHSDPAGVLSAAVSSNPYAAAMLAYNIVNHSFLDDVIAEAKQADVGVIAMKVARPVYPGPNRGTGDAEAAQRLERMIPGEWSTPQRAYLWALRNQNLSAVISNMVTADHVRENIGLPLAAG